MPVVQGLYPPCKSGTVLHMSTLTLQRNVQFLYEEQLARVETQSLGCDGWERDADNPWRVNVEVNGVARNILNRSAYIGALDEEQTVYAQLIRPHYQGGEFNRTRSVNQYLTHWFYPYRGKFHPQMVRALLNIVGAGEDSLVLDPYVGSGTTALEASLLGIRCIGIDISPLCVLLSRVKVQSVNAVAEIGDRVRYLLNKETLDPYEPSTASHANPIVADFLEIARMATLSDISRRRRDGEVALRKNLKAMLQSIEAHADALHRFRITPGRVTITQGDARKLEEAGIAEATIDAVVTSPPYSIALDYVKNDEHALNALQVELPALRASMTGVRGRGPKEKLALYNQDMQLMFSEVARILKPGARAAFVIGDATVDRREYTTTEQMGTWAMCAGLRHERELPKKVFGLYNVMKDEKILIFRKPG